MSDAQPRQRSSGSFRGRGRGGGSRGGSRGGFRGRGGRGGSNDRGDRSEHRSTKLAKTGFGGTRGRGYGAGAWNSHMKQRSLDELQAAARPQVYSDENSSNTQHPHKHNQFSAEDTPRERGRSCTAIKKDIRSVQRLLNKPVSIIPVGACLLIPFLRVVLAYRHALVHVVAEG